MYADGPGTRSITVDLVDEDETFTDRANSLTVTVRPMAPTPTPPTPVPPTPVPPTPTPVGTFLVGSGVGIPATVLRLNQDGGQVASFTPFGEFTGGVRVASADVNGDGVLDILAATGPGGAPHVKVFDGATGAELHSFFAYSSNFRGGVTVTTADVNGDGQQDLLTAARPGGEPHVKVIDGRALGRLATDGQIVDADLLASFFAFEPTFTGGVFIGTGADFNGDGLPDLILGAGAGSGPHVKVMNGADLGDIGPNGEVRYSALLASFFAFEPTFTGGVRVGESIALQDGFGEMELVRGSAAGHECQSGGVPGLLKPSTSSRSIRRLPAGCSSDRTRRA